MNKKYLNYAAFLSVYINIFGLLIFITGLGSVFGFWLIYTVLGLFFGFIGLGSDRKRLSWYGIEISVILLLASFIFLLYLGSDNTW